MDKISQWPGLVKPKWLGSIQEKLDLHLCPCCTGDNVQQGHCDNLCIFLPLCSSLGHTDSEGDSALCLFLLEAKILTSSPLPPITVVQKRPEHWCAQGRLQWAYGQLLPFTACSCRHWALKHTPGSRRVSSPSVKHLALLSMTVLNRSLACLY